VIRHASDEGNGNADPNLIYFHEVDQANHFAAWQEPDLFTTEVRAAFRSLR
jgi:pimeloyl-ACP methyl ester carboxylesterase